MTDAAGISIGDRTCNTARNRRCALTRYKEDAKAKRRIYDLLDMMRQLTDLEENINTEMDT